MSARRAWQIGGAVLVLAILVAGWFLVVLPVFNAVAAAEAERAGVAQQNDLIVADIEAMSEVDLGDFEAMVRERTAQIPYVFDESAIFQEIAGAVEGAGATLSRNALTEPIDFVGVPSAAVLPEGLTPANTPEALLAAGEAGLVVGTATIEFTADSHAVSLEVIRRLSALTRVTLVASGALSDSATQSLLAELYFLPREANEVAILEGR